MDIRVVSPTLTSAGSELASLSGEVRGIEGVARSAGGTGAGACGFPDAADALEGCMDRWSPALGETSETIAALGTALQTAAALYVMTDATAIP